MQRQTAFRINAKRFFLTYPKCTLSKEELRDELEKMHSIDHYIISEEKHEDGTPHLHAYIQFTKKLNIKDANHFNIKNFHPNTQAVKDKVSCIRYVKKDGNYIENLTYDFNDPHDFIKRKKNYDAWVDYNEQLKLKDIDYPINFLGINIDKPDPANKKRHYWFVGPPDLGKTYAINETFGGYKVYVRPNNKYPFEAYNDEDIIIYDDIHDIKFTELANVTNTYKIRTPVYGDVRYNNKFWKLNHTRIIIVVSNKAPEYYDLQDAFLSRFNIIDLRTDSDA